MLISFGAVLGKVSRFQLLIIGLIEVVFYGLNEKILFHEFHVTDVGGSMVIHAFGAYFGLAVSRIISNDKMAKENMKEGASYDSDLFAMIGKFDSIYNLVLTVNGLSYKNGSGTTNNLQITAIKA